jgi:multimeric flavodoxin WrbA
MKAVVINGSPRKNWSTSQAIDKAGKGLKDNGFEVERINLYDYTFKGCTSCFACKLKNAYDLGCRIADKAKSI